jgi:hypothetical protein
MRFFCSRPVLFSLATVGLITGVSGCQFSDRIIEVTNIGGGKNIINCTKGTISVENISGKLQELTPKGVYTPKEYAQEFNRLHREWVNDLPFSYNEKIYEASGNIQEAMMLGLITKSCK